MTYSLSRRGFMATSAALAATSALPQAGIAEVPKLSLDITKRTLDIDGRAATVFGLMNNTGKSGLILEPDQKFRVKLTNNLDTKTIIHWHGQIPPNVQDGAPNNPLPYMYQGEVRDFDFTPLAGTHWMHSHVPTQEMQLLAAPLIVRTAADVAADRQEVGMFLHDFSFLSPEEVLAEIAAGGDHDAEGNSEMASDTAPKMSGMNGMSNMENDTPAMAMDLNDFNFDAYLSNDRTLADPEVIRVENGGRVRLRIINASSATSFWIDTGKVDASLVAVDGHDIEPISGRRFGLAMAQRLDLFIDLPKGEGTYPILALREGERERTGLILATKNAHVQKISAQSEMETPAFDLDFKQEFSLRAKNPLAERSVDTAQMISLDGSMQPYVWTMNGRTWAERIPATAQSGQRAEITFMNKSMMGHPMHLHGHAFQVVGLGNQRFAGARRDTVYVPPMAKVTVAIDAGEAARWLLHCHHMPHLASGMMSEFVVSA